MQTFVVSDNDHVSERTRARLKRSGHDCPDDHVLPLSQFKGAMEDGDLIVVAMSPDPEKGLEILTEMNRHRREEDKRTVLLAVGPPDARLILRTIRQADEYIDEEDVDEALRAVLIKIVTEGPTQDEPGKVLAVLAPSGGSGSSVVATNLAVMLAKEHRKCALMDLKLGAGVIDALLDVKPTHTLVDLCNIAEETSRIERERFDRLWVQHSSGVSLLAPPNAIMDIGYVTENGVSVALNLARAIYPYIVADLDRTYSAEQVEILRGADMILMVLRLDFTSLRNTRQALDHLEQLGVDRKNVRLVINRHGQPREIRLGHAEEALGMKVLKSIPDDPKTINRSINNGVPVVLDAPRMPVSRSFVELAQAIHQELSKKPAR